MDETAARLIKRVNTLKAARQQHETVWRECYDFTYPLRGAGFSSEVLDAQSAKSRVAKLLDGTATDSARMLASALMSGMTPANAQWLNLNSESLPDDAKAWLSICATLVWENIHAANFDAEGYEANLDVVCAGWFVLYIDEDREEGGIPFSNGHWRSATSHRRARTALSIRFIAATNSLPNKRSLNLAPMPLVERSAKLPRINQTKNLIFCTASHHALITSQVRAWLKTCVLRRSILRCRERKWCASLVITNSRYAYRAG